MFDMPGGDNMLRDMLRDDQLAVYCLIPRDLAPRLHAVLRRQFEEGSSVQLIVEQRSNERRLGADRRVAQAEVAVERRLIRSVTGRRVAERRSALVAVQPPTLPRRARPYAQRLAFVERVQPSRHQLEDADTARLVTRIQAGDRDAFAILYTRYFDRVYAYLKAVLRGSQAVEDTTQQVFLDVLACLPRYQRERGAFRAWLFTIARNQAINVLRAHGRTETMAPETISRHVDAQPAHAVEQPRSASVFDRISDRELQLFVERLPAGQRQVLLLRYMLDLSTAEIAQVLGQTPEAVRQQQSRALAFLRERLVAVGRRPERHTRIGTRALVRRSRVLSSRRFSLFG